MESERNLYTFHELPESAAQWRADWPPLCGLAPLMGWS